MVLKNFLANELKEALLVMDEHLYKELTLTLKSYVKKVLCQNKEKFIIRLTILDL